MSDIPTLCDKILDQLTKIGRKTASSMLPGLPESRIHQMTGALPFVLPQSAIDLYGWSEGLRPQSGDKNEFFPGFGMDSLSEMVGMYNELSNASEFPRFRCGDMHWFPLFRSSGTDFYGVRCGNVATADGEVVYDDSEGEHRDGVTPPPVEFVSLEAMLQTLLRAYERGVYYINEQGQLSVGECSYNDEGQLINVDNSKFNEIARECNSEL